MAAKQANPTLNEPYFNLAFLSAHAGRKQEARDFYQQALANGAVPDPEIESLLEGRRKSTRPRPPKTATNHPPPSRPRPPTPAVIPGNPPPPPRPTIFRPPTSRSPGTTSPGTAGRSAPVCAISSRGRMPPIPSPRRHAPPPSRAVRFAGSCSLPRIRRAGRPAAGFVVPLRRSRPGRIRDHCPEERRHHPP